LEGLFHILRADRGTIIKSQPRSRRRDSQTDDDLVEVLLVEDDQSVLEMYRLKLELDGYRVSTAGDGEDGLRKAEELRPDIIFLDIRLPKMDGFEVLRRLRSQETTKEIPVIILSNYGEDDLVARGLRLGAHEYLIKARTTPSSLSEGIGEWLRE
jgi:two-component system, response regulator